MRAAAPDRGSDAAPVGVMSEDSRLDQLGIRDGTRGGFGLPVVFSALHVYGDELRGSFAVGRHRAREGGADELDRCGGLGIGLAARLDPSRAGSCDGRTGREQQAGVVGGGIPVVGGPRVTVEVDSPANSGEALTYNPGLAVKAARGVVETMRLLWCEILL